MVHKSINNCSNNSLENVNICSNDKAIEKLCIVGLTILGAILIYITPPKHSPDANPLYTVTLLLSEGRFLDSIEGTRGPLMAWLCAPLVALGMSLPNSFRLINFATFVIFLFAVRSVVNQLGLQRKFKLSLIVTLGLQTSYFIVGLVTTDLLATALYGVFTARLIGWLSTSSVGSTIAIGTLTALCYYAKSLQGIIALTVLSFILIVRVCKREKSLAQSAAAAILLAFLMVAPWILVLSTSYGTFSVSAQQQIACGQLPNRDFSMVQKPSRGVPFVQCLLEKLGKDSLFSLRYLYSTGIETLYSPGGAPIYLALLAIGIFALAQNQKGRRSAADALVVTFTFHFLAYVIIWGPYIRYYLPILMHAAALSILGYAWLEYKLCSFVTDKSLVSRCTKLFCTCFGIILCIGALQSSYYYFESDFEATRHGIIDRMVQIPILQSGTGAIAGNELSDIYAPLTAFQLRRPFYLYLAVLHHLSVEQLQQRFHQDKVTQVIYSGEPWPILDAIPGISSTGPYVYDGYKFKVYDVP